MFKNVNFLIYLHEKPQNFTVQLKLVLILNTVGTRKKWNF